jgi:hypothetical protein
VPVTPTEKVAVCPTETPALTGWVAIDGWLSLRVLLTLVKAAQPERTSATERTRNKKNIIF